MTSGIELVLRDGLTQLALRHGLAQLLWEFDTTTSAVPILRGQVPATVCDDRVYALLASWAAALDLSPVLVMPYGLTQVQASSSGLWVHLWGVHDHAAFEACAPAG